MANKLIKNIEKNLFRNKKKEVTEWESVRKMMAQFHEEMEREWSEEEKVLFVSQENDKTHMPSYSTMPGFTCMHNGKYPPCFTSGNCYALYDLRNPLVIRNAVHNTVLIIKYPEAFERSFEEMVQINSSIRLHVEGDWCNKNEIKIVDRVTKRNPGCMVLTYTKKYDMVNSYVDDNGMFANNFVMLFSKWEGLPIRNPYHFPECHVYESIDKYLNAKDSRKCGTVRKTNDNTYEFIKGNCFQCFVHHIRKDGIGGCFDMEVGHEINMATAMLAH